MSYQSFLRSTSGSVNKVPSPSSISRKPPASSSSPSAPQTSSPSVHATVARIQAPHAINTASNPPFTPTSSTNSAASPSASAAVPPTDPINPPPAAQTSLTREQVDAALKQCLALQTTATTLHEKRPFAALLLGPDNTSILLTHFSITHVQHAETELARLASVHFSQKFLATCTLVSTWEPCAMCTGTIYWSNIGRVLYAAGEAKLKDLTGGDNDENMTLSLPCRDVLKTGQKEIEVIGPVPEWEEKVVKESGKWWKEHQSPDTGRQREGSVNGSVKTGSFSGVSLRQGTPTTWTGESSVLSSINDEGEYTADLDIDWMR
ncbi:uncharacterized protein A1O9_06601 [Exophiala aquamarina CBS 119918]|uniref:CMP/dCMP-type deaminase domain-containing protein n=1 Tax=Exophiala aquamarina CBS 119918 TaxID=1182545 RepID=A0A072PT34_9EURO|nr:uncharacterized protein A1O9_06601 [Exophiala aquamarina CBS 119918]KEF58675.1 hypothetical protein A1O9_06601 [Exophiala aquamarina CBS 119918]